jgi:hypothetical protein
LATESEDANAYLNWALRLGETNYKTMALLDKAHTTRFGHPEPTQVRITPVRGKAILVSGHDLHDLEQILEETKNSGINVYTHGEMLPALAYPKFKEYPHLIGNYGGAWQDQQKEFATLAEKDFNVKTEIFTGYIAEILSKFKSPLTKTRLLCLKPKGLIAPHVDFPYYEQIRVHACIESNDDTWWEVEGERFKIPSDGNFYWFDTGKYHAVWNDGKTDRTVLSVNLSVYKDKDNNVLQDSSLSLAQLISSGSI